MINKLRIHIHAQFTLTFNTFSVFTRVTKCRLESSPGRNGNLFLDIYSWQFSIATLMKVLLPSLSKILTSADVRIIEDRNLRISNLLILIKWFRSTNVQHSQSCTTQKRNSASLHSPISTILAPPRGNETHFAFSQQPSPHPSK